MLGKIKENLLRFARQDKRPVSRACDYIQLGLQAENEQSLDEAILLYQLAIEADPESIDANLNLGIALFESGKISAARQSLTKVIELSPANPYGYYNLGNIEYSSKRFEQAERLFRSALKCKPDFLEARVALANSLEELGKEEDAIDELIVAIEYHPDSKGALLNFSMLALKHRRYEDVEDAARRILDIHPTENLALELLVNSLWGQGLCADALKALGQLRGKMGYIGDLESRELFLLNYDLQITEIELFSRHREFGRKLEEAVPANKEFNKNESQAGRRLRVGYLSADFNWHPVALFLIPVLEQHSKDGFLVYCYYTAAKEDDITKAMRQLPDYWRDVSSLSDDELFAEIHKDGVDILVDLAGHTSNSRLALFARQPAPVQVSWMGYLNTSGLTRIQYRICDERTDPLGLSDALHTEKLIRMPHSQWCYRPFIKSDLLPDAPVMNNGFITFGSFNHVLKVSPKICEVWAEILKKVPQARLLFVGLNSTRKMSEILTEMILNGVEGDRIGFSTRTNLASYYNLISDADIALDTYPYGGGTTTFDALWMGVPVVAAKGSTPTSRSAASILESVGLDEWVAPSIDEYVRVAVERAHDLDRIKALRKSLRSMLQTSPLMDEERFVRDLESAYRQMWQEYCNKTGPFARTQS